MSGLSDALRIALGGLSGGLQGYGQKQELLRTEAEAKRLRERQEAADKQKADAEELANALSGVRSYNPGDTLGKGERKVSLPSGQQRVIGRAPGDVLKDQAKSEEIQTFVESLISNKTISPEQGKSLLSAPDALRDDLIRRYTTVTKPETPYRVAGATGVAEYGADGKPMFIPYPEGFEKTAHKAELSDEEKEAKGLAYIAAHPRNAALANALANAFAADPSAAEHPGLTTYNLMKFIPRGADKGYTPPKQKPGSDWRSRVAEAGGQPATPQAAPSKVTSNPYRD